MVPHPRIRAIGPALDHDLALEHAARGVADHALGQLRRLAVQPAVRDDAGQVGVAGAAQRIKPVQPHLGRFPTMGHRRRLTLQFAARRHRRLAIDGTRRDLDVDVRDRNGLGRFLDQDDAGDLGPRRHVDVDPVVGDIVPPGTLVAFQQQQPGPRPRRDLHRGGMPRPRRIRHEPQAQGLHPRRHESLGPDCPAVAEGDLVPDQGLERPATGDDRLARRHRGLAQHPAQVRVFPRLNPPRRIGGGVPEVQRAAHILLPSWEKVARGARRMRGLPATNAIVEE